MGEHADEGGRWVEWGHFHSAAAAREAVSHFTPGPVRYRRAPAGRVYVDVRLTDSPAPASPTEGAPT